MWQAASRLSHNARVSERLFDGLSQTGFALRVTHPSSCILDEQFRWPQTMDFSCLCAYPT